jgi:hypothetical protein
MSNFKSFSSLSRRQFLSTLTLTSLGLVVKDYSYPQGAFADTNENQFIETYQVFIPYTLARNGGLHTIILRSGNSISFNISENVKENDTQIITAVGENGKDVKVIFHSLFDIGLRFAETINAEIDQANFIEPVSNRKCKTVYFQLESGKYVSDITSLELLDYIVKTADLSSVKKQEEKDHLYRRYEFASNYARLKGIELVIEKALSNSTFEDQEKKLIQGTFEYIRAGEPVPSFEALNTINNIIGSSSLPLSIKEIFLAASTNSLALTIDFLIVKLIEQQTDQNILLAVYKKLRDKKEIEVNNLIALDHLDEVIKKSNIPNIAKLGYNLISKEAEDKRLKSDDDDKKEDFAGNFNNITEQLQNAYKNGSKILPNATKLLGSLGAKAATGISISSLSGAAATNATLAFFGGGSVASGGFGMLGGIVVLSGGSALIGAAGVISIALVSQMDSKDRANLGIAVGAGTLIGATAMLAAWVTVGTMVATGLTGAAAITATIAALGGMAVMTGGISLIVSGSASLIWMLLSSQKKRVQQVLTQLETRIYAVIEPALGEPLIHFIIDTFKPKKYKGNKCFVAPQIDLDLLAKALQSWLEIETDEKVIALLDDSTLFGKSGIVLTSHNRMLYKDSSGNLISVGYEDFKTKEYKGFLLSLTNTYLRKCIATYLLYSEEITEELFTFLPTKSNQKSLNELVMLIKLTEKFKASDSLSYDNLNTMKRLLEVNDKIHNPKIVDTLRTDSYKRDKLLEVLTACEEIDEEILKDLSDVQNRNTLHSILSFLRLIKDEDEKGSFAEFIYDLGNHLATA